MYGWFIVFLLFTTSLFPNILENSSAERASLGYLDIISNTPESFYYNPAKYTNGIALGYTKPFSINTVSLGNVSICNSYKYLHLGVSENYLESEYYSRYISTISIGCSVTEYLCVGSNIKYVDVIENLRSNSLSSDIGVMVKHNSTRLSVVINNVLAKKRKEFDLTKNLVAELSINVGKISSVAVGIEKEEDQDMMVKCGTLFKIYRSLSLKLGYTVKADFVSAGFTYNLRNFSLDYGVSVHDELEATHYISIKYAID